MKLSINNLYYSDYRKRLQMIERGGYLNANRSPKGQSKAPAAGEYDMDSCEENEDAIHHDVDSDGHVISLSLHSDVWDFNRLQKFFTRTGYMG